MNAQDRIPVSFNKLRSLGSIMAQGGDTTRASADTLPELLHQGGSTKRRGGEPKRSLGNMMGQR